MREFSISESADPIKFKIDEDVFVAVAPNRLPANALIRYAEGVAIGRMHSAHMRFYQDVLEDESFALFSDRLDSKERPITLKMMADVTNWLVEEIYAGKGTGLLSL